MTCRKRQWHSALSWPKFRKPFRARSDTSNVYVSSGQYQYQRCQKGVHGDFDTFFSPLIKEERSKEFHTQAHRHTRRSYRHSVIFIVMPPCGALLFLGIKPKLQSITPTLSCLQPARGRTPPIDQTAVRTTRKQTNTYKQTNTQTRKQTASFTRCREEGGGRGGRLKYDKKQ